jgi:hypothetical protein
MLSDRSLCPEYAIGATRRLLLVGDIVRARAKSDDRPPFIHTRQKDRLFLRRRDLLDLLHNGNPIILTPSFFFLSAATDLFAIPAYVLQDRAGKLIQ